MAHEPLLSPEMFDYLRKLEIEPYTKLNDSAREQLGDGVRLLTLFVGESFVTRKPALRLTVLSGKVRMEPAGTLLDLGLTRERPILTSEGETRLVAEENAVMVLAEAAFLDTLSSWTELAEYARQSGDESLLRRLLAVRHTVAFQRLPMEYVMEALKLMTRRPVKAGDIIINQGERGDAFYVLWSGRAEVWKADIYDDEQKLVDVIGPKDAFGDDALVTHGNRNATVKMIEDGELLVLGEADFNKLMSQPLIEEVAPTEVPALLDAGWKALDVRYAEEFEDGHIPGAIHLPLPELRHRADEVLDRNGKYLTVCLSGKRSAVAAFLLKQRGFHVQAMKEGMSAWEGETVS